MHDVSKHENGMGSRRQKLAKLVGRGVEGYFKGVKHSLDSAKYTSHNAQSFIESAVFPAFDAMVAAWHAGDEAQLAAMMNQMPKRNRLALLRDRNAAWIPKIEAMLDGSDDVLVIVGAGHLVGEDSVIAMLREKGYTLTRQ